MHLITIVPRGQAGGYTLSLPTEEDDLQTYSQLMDFVAMGLGGHAAEQLYLGEFTTGATSDLKKANGGLPPHGDAVWHERKAGPGLS